MKAKEYEEAVYLANLINSGKVPDWSVSHDGIKLLAKALLHSYPFYLEEYCNKADIEAMRAFLSAWTAGAVAT